MRGYACSHCGAKSKSKMQPPSMGKAVCPECGRGLTVKMSETETMVIAKVTPKSRKRTAFG